MTLHLAASTVIPSGPYRGRTLASVSLDDPAWVIEQAERAGDASPIDRALKVVAEQIIENYLDDIMAGRVVEPDEFTRAAWVNDGVFGPAGYEAVLADHRKRGRAFEETEDVQQGSLFERSA